MGSAGSLPIKSGTAPKDDLFNELKITQFSFEAALAKLKWVCGQLENFQTARTAAITPAISFLSLYTSASKYGNDLARLWGDKLVEYQALEVIVGLWPSFWSPSDFLKDLNNIQKEGAVDTEAVDDSRVILENMWIICRILWNGSDASKIMCARIVQLGIIEEIMVKILDRHDFNPKKFKKDTVRTYLVKAGTGVIHNCLRLHKHQTKSKFRASNGVKVLQKYLDSDVQMVRTKASICLAFGINETEIDVINATDDIMKYIITRLLAPSLNAKDHRTLGFSSEETLESLNELAQNDENKLQMVKHGVLPLYLRVLNDPLNDEELLQVTKGLWILSFKPENAKIIKQEYQGCIKTLDTLRSHENVEISKAATGALWNIDDRSLSAKGRPGTMGKKKKKSDSAGGRARTFAHVMISYDWGHKEVVRQLNRRMKEMGYNTWLDADKMSGSTLEAMAEAIENSCVVIVCMSDRYKNSPSCRTEAEYAYRLGKPIIPIRTEYKYQADGWLGILMGTKLYFDCYSAEKVNDACTKLAKELGDRGKLGIGPSVEQKRSVSALGAPPDSAYSKAQSRSEVEKWKPAQVKEWLTKIGLGGCAGKFSQFDGPLILELQAMYHKSPTVFYQSARSDLGLASLSDLLKFTSHLDRLI